MWIMMMVVSYIVIMRVVVVDIGILVGKVITDTVRARRRRLPLIMVRWICPHNATEMKSNLQYIFHASRFNQFKTSAKTKALWFNRVY